MNLQDVYSESSGILSSLYPEGASLTLINSRVRDCHAGGTGGALAADTHTTVGGQPNSITVIDSSIIGCSATAGGGALTVSRSSLADRVIVPRSKPWMKLTFQRIGCG